VSVLVHPLAGDAEVRSEFAGVKQYVLRALRVHVTVGQQLEEPFGDAERDRVYCPFI
jgi:hypothetical protein